MSDESMIFDTAFRVGNVNVEFFVQPHDVETDYYARFSPIGKAEPGDIFYSGYMQNLADATTVVRSLEMYYDEQISVLQLARNLRNVKVIALSQETRRSKP